jgi:hypothetical protein
MHGKTTIKISNMFRYMCNIFMEKAMPVIKNQRYCVAVIYGFLGL